MGSLGGHVLPGSFFIIFSIWWSFITAIRYAQSKMRSPFKKNTLVGYKSTAVMPCVCLPCGNLSRAPIESFIKIFFTFVGVLIEFIFGWEKVPKHGGGGGGGETHHHNHALNMTESMVMVKTSDELVWAFDWKNGQHITMYSAFGLGAIVEILLHYGYDLPQKLDYVCGAVAFMIEGFLFANHLHSREPLDIHVHTLLVYAIEGCVVFTCLEFFKPNEILFTYGRIVCTLLQGTWFYQVGFVLYPPTDNPAWQWDKQNHEQIMIITMSFAWHIFFIFTGLLIQMWLIKCVYASSKTLSNKWDELLIVNDRVIHYNLSNSSLVKANRETTNFLKRNVDDDDDDDDENVTFDTQQLINSKRSLSTSTRTNNMHA